VALASQANSDRQQTAWRHGGGIAPKRDNQSAGMASMRLSQNTKGGDINAAAARGDVYFISISKRGILA